MFAVILYLRSLIALHLEFLEWLGYPVITKANFVQRKCFERRFGIPKKEMPACISSPGIRLDQFI